MQSLLAGGTQSARPFLPTRSKQNRRGTRIVSTCKCSSESPLADRRAVLAALLSLGFVAKAEAKTATAPAKKDAYQELQEIVKGRTGSTSLLKSFKADEVQKTVQKGIVAPLTSSPQKAALAKPASSSGAGAPSTEVLGGLGLLGLIGVVTASNSGGKAKPAASKKPGLGTQRISAPAPAKQAARKVASAGTKVFGTQKAPAPVKQVKKLASKAQAAAKPAGGLFGTRKVGPSTGTAKVASKAAQPVQKVKQVSKQATQRVTKQATRKVQQGTGSVKELLNEDTSSTLGAAGVLGFALLVAGGLVLGTPKPAAKPAAPAPKELAPRPVKRAAATVQAAVKEAPKVAEKVTPQPPSLPTPPSLPSPTPPPVTAEKPKVPSGPDLIPEAVKKPQTPSTPPPSFPKPSTPSGPDLKPAAPPSTTQAKNPASTLAAAPAAPSPATYGVLALGVAGLAAAAVASFKQNEEAGATTAPAATPSASASATAGDNTEEAIAKRKAQARKWIDDWRAKQK
ncbi:hypothetical protein COCOBI_16-1080 [Coccomyxa sp. Obi]|nr:hypothetical protein COCOBI_16-1080 [Coccomyxa sp. Obi]